MKNIYLLSTPNPSRLFYSGASEKLYLNKYPVSYRTFERSPQNVHITSEEAIKVKDYAISLDTNTIFEVNESDLKGIEKFPDIYKK